MPSGKECARSGSLSFVRFVFLSGLRVYLWIIGLMELVRPPTASSPKGARVYCGCQPGPTRVALHPGRMVEVPERQPYVRWTTTYYVFEEMRYVDLSPHSFALDQVAAGGIEETVGNQVEDFKNIGDVGHQAAIEEYHLQKILR